MTRCILALDQGTTSSRAMLISHDGGVIASAQRELTQILPVPGVVEHDPEEIWQSQLATAREVIKRANSDLIDVVAVGLTNQRETTILWDRETGKPVSNAIVWQSRVSAPICDQLRADGLTDLFRSKTGLVIDPYFSGTKIKYLLDNVSGLRSRAEKGDILFGTVDSFLTWHLTGGRVHATDYSNASRTLLFNIHTLAWDDELLDALKIPRSMLPDVRASSGVLGDIDEQWFGRRLPLASLIGDQQAATFGQACFNKGDAKITYGTGAFVLLNTGATPAESKNNLLTTIGWGIDGKITYCLEGAIFIAGAAVQWLRDGLGIIENAGDVESLAAQVADCGGVYLVPAFVGLGAPHWDANARGAILGLTRGSKREHLARAALESIALQSWEVLSAMQEDADVPLKELKADGGASKNNLLLQFQADLLNVPVSRPVVFETTALGAAYLAGLAVGFWDNQQELTKHWQLDRIFSPQMSDDDRRLKTAAWQEAVKRSLGWATGSQPN